MHEVGGYAVAGSLAMWPEMLTSSLAFSLGGKGLLINAGGRNYGRRSGRLCGRRCVRRQYIIGISGFIGAGAADGVEGSIGIEEADWGEAALLLVADILYLLRSVLGGGGEAGGRDAADERRFAGLVALRARDIWSFFRVGGQGAAWRRVCRTVTK